ncbi:MAG: lytic transglycosylase domain-containing protein [Polyangiaceae bacterium]|nr:lytic transglycosylase domain-containing protein [Polyangiaceae bacterium]
MLAPLPKPVRFVLGALVLGTLSLVPHAASADIYTYTDAQGNVHVTSQPTRGKPGTKVDKISSGNANGSKKKTRDIMPVMPSDRSPERHNRYDAWIREGARLYRLPEELIRAVIKCESDFDPRVVSPVGAQGLMQIMPATALRMQVRDAFDPRENILGGARYLRILANTFNGDLELTVAGYNAGEAAVLRYQGIPPYQETQGYVGCVVSHYRTFKSARIAERETMPAKHTP